METFGVRGLPQEVQMKILQDALLKHHWWRRQNEIEWWIGPVFDTWLRIAVYERQWPGSTEADEPGRVAVAWD